MSEARCAVCLETEEHGHDSFVCDECQASATDACGRARTEERKAVVAFLRDVARRVSVQTGERNVGGTDAFYLAADAIERGEHLTVPPISEESR